MLNKKLDKILPKVQKPGRYVGGELNSVIKNKEDVDVRFAFCFPDTYEIGMSHLGIKILYSIFNNVDLVRARVCAVDRHGAGDDRKRHSALRLRERRPRQRV